MSTTEPQVRLFLQYASGSKRGIETKQLLIGNLQSVIKPGQSYHAHQKFSIQPKIKAELRLQQRWADNLLIILALYRW